MNYWIALTLFTTFGPALLAADILFSSKRVYEPWAKAAAVLAAFAGVGWGCFDYAVAHHFYSTRYGYQLFLALQHVCGGMIVGFLGSVFLKGPSGAGSSSIGTERGK